MRSAAQGEITKRNEQREQHGKRCADGNGPHVRAHQSAHKRHGQDGGDDGPGGEGGGIANFVHRLHRDVRQGAPLILGEVEVPGDVLHHHNGVVHQDADGEDQREEGDAVERVAIDEVDEQGQRQGDRHGSQHHHR